MSSNKHNEALSKNNHSITITTKPKPTSTIFFITMVVDVAKVPLSNCYTAVAMNLWHTTIEKQTQFLFINTIMGIDNYFMATLFII
jgi:hypothetical protein